MTESQTQRLHAILDRGGVRLDGDSDLRAAAIAVLRDIGGFDPATATAPDGTRFDECHTDYLATAALTLDDEADDASARQLDLERRLQEERDAHEAAFSHSDAPHDPDEPRADELTDQYRADSAQRRPVPRPANFDHEDRPKLLKAARLREPGVRHDHLPDHKLARHVIKAYGGDLDHRTRNGTLVRNRSDDFLVPFALGMIERLDEASDAPPVTIAPSAERAQYVQRQQTAYLGPPTPDRGEIERVVSSGSRDDLVALVGRLSAPSDDRADESPRDAMIRRNHEASKPNT